MAKHAAKTHAQKCRYLRIAVGAEGKLPACLSRRCARLESFAPGSAESKMSIFVFGSEVLRYAKIAATAPNIRDAAATDRDKPFAAIPRIRPQTVEKLTKVSPAESHFMPGVLACGGSGAPRAMLSMAPKAHDF